MKKLFLADDHKMLLGGLIKIISAEDDMIVSETAGNVKATLDKLTYTKIDLLIADYNLTGGEPVSWIRLIKQKYPDVKIIVMSAFDDPGRVQEMINAGADGYLLKKDSHQELIYAIKNVLQGRVFLSNAINTKSMREFIESKDD